MCGELSCGDVNLTVVNWVPKIIQRAKKNGPAISITTIIERARLDQLYMLSVEASLDCQHCTATLGIPTRVPINTTVDDSSLLSWCPHVKGSTPRSHKRSLDTSRIPYTHFFDCTCFYANK